MSIGALIRRLREEMRYTQAEIADAAGVSRSWISRVENGEIAQPDPQLLRALAKPLGKKPDELMIAAGYLSHDGAPPAEDMSIDDILREMNRLAEQLKRKTAGSLDGDREPSRSGRSGTMTLERPR